MARMFFTSGKTRNSSEEEKPLPTRRWRVVIHFRHMRQFLPLVGRQRIVQEQRARFLLAELVHNHFVGRLEAQRPCARVMGVGGDEMDKPLPDPLQGDSLGRGTKASGQRPARDLSEAAL